MEPRIALVTMPFSFATGPSLGLSLLQATLREKGIDSDIHYLQLPFAARIGAGAYFKLAQFAPRSLIGEWLFAEALYGERLPPPQAYVEEILSAYQEELGGRLLANLADLHRTANEYLNECLKMVDWGKYDLIGFTSTFSQNLASLALAQRIRQRWEDKIIVFGGANWEGEMGLELLRQHDFVDFACSGEADWLFPDLVRRLAASAGLEMMPGLFYRQGGKVVENGLQTAPIYDLDSLPIPDFDDYFAQLESSGLGFTPDQIHLPIETSRGCWWGERSQCTFCGLNPELMKFRSKSGPRSLEEFAALAKRYPNIRRFDAVDKIFEMHFFDDLVPGLIDLGLDLDIFYFVKANLNKEQLERLRQAGIQRIQPGLESLDSDALRLMRKGTTAIQNLQLLKWARQVGMDVIWNYIGGFPGEDPFAYTRIAGWVDSLVHLDPPVGPADPVRLDRYSPYFYDTASFGMVNVRPAKAYHYVYPFEDEVLSRMGYYFDFEYEDGRDPGEYARPLNQAIVRWRSTAGRAVLCSLEGDERLTLFDTRPTARQGEIVLTSLAKRLYQLCDEGHTVPALLRTLANTPSDSDAGISDVSREQTRVILDDLVDKGLMIRDGERYLSLATPIDEPAQVFLDHFVSNFGAAVEG